MAEIVRYSGEQLRKFAVIVSKKYTLSLQNALPFIDWEERALTQIFNALKIEYPQEVRIAPTAREMLDILQEHNEEFNIIGRLPESQIDAERAKLIQKLLQPKKTLKIAEPILDSRTNTPIWFGNAQKELSVYVGYKDGNRETPIALNFGDKLVHAKLSGGTGSGKSVTLHTMINNTILMYPPWECNMYLADFKITELPKYATPVKTPHVKAVIGSENTVLATSVFQAYAQEMVDRQVLFNFVGVESLNAFRIRYNLVMPRCLLLVDEYAQLFANFDKAEAAGSSTAAEDKKAVNTIIGEIARLGRTMGMHMLLSSQSLVGLIEDKTDTQFSGGIALKVNTPSDSTAVIGNDASAYLTGKGKGILNTNRAGKKESENEIVQIPFILCELTPEEIAKGELSFVSETVSFLKEQATKLNIDTNLFYYSDNDFPPLSEFNKDLGLALDRFNNTPFKGNSERDNIERDIYKKTTFTTLALGRGVTYSMAPQFYLDLQRKQSQNIVVSGTNKEYILQLLTENFLFYRANGIKFKNVAVNGNEVSFRLGKVGKLINNKEYGDITYPSNTLPVDWYEKVSTRSIMMDITNNMKYANESGSVDVESAKYDVINFRAVLEYIFKSIPNNKLIQYEGWTVKNMEKLVPYLKDAFNKIKEIDINTTVEYCKANTISLNNFEQSCVIINEIVSRSCGNLFAITEIAGTKKYLEPKDFPAIVIWLIGADTLSDVVEKVSERIQVVTKALLRGPMYNIFTVITANQWAKLTALAENCDIVIEQESRAFFMDITMPGSVNIYTGTFQVHDRESRSRTIVKEFKI